MDTYRQNLDDAVGTPPAVAKDSYFVVRGNTRTVAVWHLKQSPAEKKAEAQRQTARKNEEDARERAKFEQGKACYSVSSAEWDESEKKWRAFLTSRSGEGAAHDFVSSWRDSVPSESRKADVVGEAQFSRLVLAQHDQCVLCEAVNTMSVDPALSEREKEWHVRRLLHRYPKRLISPPTGVVATPGAQGELTFKDLTSASAWGHARASSGPRKTVVATETLFENLVDKADAIESTLGVKRGDYKLSQSITKFLVKGAGLPSDNEIVDYLTNNKALRQHSEAVLQRVAVYRANKGAAQSALVAANRDERLSLDDIEKASKAKADALELERDLTMLEMRQKANRACIERARKGHSMLKHNDVFCEIRRSQKATGYYHHQRGGHKDCKGYGGWYTDCENDDESDDEEEEDEEVEVGPEVGFPFVKESIFGKTEKMQGVYQQHQDLPLTQPRDGERVTASTGSTPPFALTQSPEAQTDGPSMYFKTMQEFNRQTREQEDKASVSTDDGPLNLEQALETASGVVGAAGSSTEVATTPSSKGKEKKDSKVEGLLKEDGVSLKDFAAEPEQKKGKGLRKLSVNAGSLSRPRWR